MNKKTRKRLERERMEKEDWVTAKWRPMMGWMYLTVCTCDFIIFPVLWSIVQALSHGKVETEWTPLTLQGAGLFHMAMGAIIGVSAYGRTQERMAGVIPPIAGQSPMAAPVTTTTTTTMVQPPVTGNKPPPEQFPTL